MAIAPKAREIKGLVKSEIQYIARGMNVSYARVLELIRAVLLDTLAATILDLEIWIDSKVPKRTGTLRAELKKWLHGSNVTDGLLRLVLGSSLYYAEDVNQMTTSMVRHQGQVGYVYYENWFGVRGKVILSDPRAIGHFFDHMLEFAKERIRINLVKAKNRHLGMKGKLAGKLRRAIE